MQQMTGRVSHDPAGMGAGTMTFYKLRVSGTQLAIAELAVAYAS